MNLPRNQQLPPIGPDLSPERLRKLLEGCTPGRWSHGEHDNFSAYNSVVLAGEGWPICAVVDGCEKGDLELLSLARAMAERIIELEEQLNKQ